MLRGLLVIVFYRMKKFIVPAIIKTAIHASIIAMQKNKTVSNLLAILRLQLSIALDDKDSARTIKKVKIAPANKPTKPRKRISIIRQAPD